MTVTFHPRRHHRRRIRVASRNILAPSSRRVARALNANANICAIRADVTEKVIAGHIVAVALRGSVQLIIDRQGNQPALAAFGVDRVHKRLHVGRLRRWIWVGQCADFRAQTSQQHAFQAVIFQASAFKPLGHDHIAIGIALQTWLG